MQTEAKTKDFVNGEMLIGEAVAHEEDTGRGLRVSDRIVAGPAGRETVGPGQHQAERECCESYGGHVPRTAASLRGFQ